MHQLTYVAFLCMDCYITKLTVWFIIVGACRLLACLHVAEVQRTKSRNWWCTHFNHENKTYSCAEGFTRALDAALHLLPFRLLANNTSITGSLRLISPTKVVDVKISKCALDTPIPTPMVVQCGTYRQASFPAVPMVARHAHNWLGWILSDPIGRCFHLALTHSLHFHRICCFVPNAYLTTFN